MASAVGKQPAAARLVAVAAAGCLPTATNEGESSYTTCGNTTILPHSHSISFRERHCYNEPC